MKSTLVDAGPLIALFDRSEREHLRVARCISSYRGRLLTTWVVAAEAAYMLGFRKEVQLDFLSWVERGAIKLFDLPQTELTQMIGLMDKYSDRPMDFADASLVTLAMYTGIRTILSIDSDFDIYRLPDRTRLRNLLR